MIKEIVLTVEQGKRLIAEGIAADAAVIDAAKNHKLLVIAGTTNGYVVKALMKALGYTGEFDAASFRRGVTLPKGVKLPPAPAHDVLFDHGEVDLQSDVFEAAPQMERGDIIIKGANAYYPANGECGVLIGHPAGGTTIPIITAAIGKRVRVVIPIGLEKRVDRPMSELAAIANRADTDGARLMPLPGEARTEIDAIRMLTGAEATLIAAGGFMGAEGCIYLAVEGSAEQLKRVTEIVNAL